MRAKRLFGCALLTLVFLGLASQTNAEVTVPDNGSGTADMPLQTDLLPWGAGVFRIIDGLPPGTTIDIAPIMTPPTASTEEPGGSLGGTIATGEGMTLRMDMTGTGDLAGYKRTIVLPHFLELHTAPRIPGAPVQSFDTDMFLMQGQITGDPDFDLLRITGGTSLGMPSPGHTTLTRLGEPGSDWAVDSFFDITYRIDFVGQPGSSLDGMSGSTTGTIRMGTTPEPGALALLTTGGIVLLAYAWRRRRCQWG